MKKEMIIVIIIVIAIITIDSFTHNYTKLSFSNLNDDLEQIREISESIEIENQGNNEERQEELNEKIKTMEEKWKIINRKTAFYIEHDELEKVNASMVKFKSYIQLEEYTEAVPEIENCKYILNHIRDKEAMKIINLF